MRPWVRGLLARLLSRCFQTRCLGCRAWGRSPVCASCFSALPPFPASACPRCLGVALPCPLCTPQSPLRHVYAAAPYSGVIRRAVHGLKFDARADLADWLGQLMGEALPALDPDWIVVAVPLSGDRLRERGYNQAEWLARRIPGFRRMPHALRRTRHMPSQVGQGRADRWTSLENAFVASPEVAGKRILLVDDVLTTGATLFWAADALQCAGATEVRALVAARALLRKKLSPRG